MPPARDSLPPDPTTPIFVANASQKIKRDFANSPFSMNIASCPTTDDSLPRVSVKHSHTTTRRDVVLVVAETNNQNLLYPPYVVNNAAGALSSRTAFVSFCIASSVPWVDPYIDRHHSCKWSH